jgi:dTDP-4-dehydrorhamnose 3,5-epimerase
MQLIPTRIPDVRIVQPVVHGDDRGFYMETWRASVFGAAGLDTTIAQQSMSKSKAGVVRGLHYQIQHAQGKLVRVVQGEIFDVALDLRRSSPTFGQFVAERLSAENKRALWIPAGFAHGFYTVDDAVVLYNQSDTWYPDFERIVLWNDPKLGIPWPIPKGTQPVVSPRDAQGTPFDAADHYS